MEKFGHRGGFALGAIEFGIERSGDATKAQLGEQVCS